jgi:hypothetical protein
MLNWSIRYHPLRSNPVFHMERPKAMQVSNPTVSRCNINDFPSTAQWSDISLKLSLKSQRNSKTCHHLELAFDYYSDFAEHMLMTKRQSPCVRCNYWTIQRSGDEWTTLIDDGQLKLGTAFSTRAHAIVSKNCVCNLLFRRWCTLKYAESCILW